MNSSVNNCKDLQRQFYWGIAFRMMGLGYIHTHLVEPRRLLILRGWDDLLLHNLLFNK